MAERQLACTTAAADHQKAWFADLRRDVFEHRRPYAIVQADMPLELFEVMQVPVDEIKRFALVLFAIVMLAGCGLVVVELFQARLVRWERRFVATGAAFLAVAAVLGASVMTGLLLELVDPVVLTSRQLQTQTGMIPLGVIPRIR